MTTSISRSSYTWLAYAMLGYYAYMQASLGPIMPFLREELNLSYTVAGLHISLFAVGMSFTGMFGEKMVAQMGRHRAFWFGGAGMAFGGFCFIFAPIAVLTITASLIMGLLGGYTLILVQSTLSDEFGKNRAVALTESNIVASIFAAFAPAIVGAGIAQFGDWRLVLWLGIAFWIVAFLTHRKIDLPAQRKSQKSSDSTKTNESLPPLFWLYWGVIFAGVATEWCVIFWTPDFLVNYRQLSAETASFAMTIFFVSMIFGRVVGSYFSRRFRPLYLLLSAQIITIVGFPLLWLSDNLIVSYIGMILVALGIANLFPLGLSTASNIGEEQPDKASSRVSQAAGLAILTIPLLLGNFADQIGIFRAFGLVIILLLIQPFIVAIGLRLERVPAEI